MKQDGIVEKTKGIVIRCRDYRETSQLVWFYTRDFGKIKFIAKASRVRQKRFKGKLDLFNLCEVVFYKNPKSELHLLNECDVLEPFVKIRQDLGRIAVASYFAELVDASVGLEDPLKEIYSLVVNVFKRLSVGKDPDFLRCVFEVRLMNYLGHMPNMDNRKDLSKGTKAVVKRILESRAIDKLVIMPSQLNELKKVMRLVIDYSVDKRLKSLDFLEGICKRKLTQI